MKRMYKTKYEEKRLKNIERNNEILKELGLLSQHDTSHQNVKLELQRNPKKPFEGENK